LTIFNKILNYYSSTIDDEINQIEENSNFKYFKGFFENFFAIKSKNSKIKKCYFEIKNCFQKLQLNSEACKIIVKCSKLFPNDIVITYELLKQYIIISDFTKIDEIITHMKNQYNNLDEETKIIYENYINFSECLILVSKGDYDVAKNKLTDILRNNPDNIVVINNVSALNFYMNRVERAYSDFKVILDKDQMNCWNEVTFSNINTLTDLFNLPKYP